MEKRVKRTMSVKEEQLLRLASNYGSKVTFMELDFEGMEWNKRNGIIDLGLMTRLQIGDVKDIEIEGPEVKKGLRTSFNVQQLMDEISEWSDKTFDNGNVLNKERALPIGNDLRERVTELLEYIILNVKGRPGIEIEAYQRLGEELSDCLILLFDCSMHLGYNADMLFTAAHHKMEVNKQREWDKPKPHGVVNHVRKEEVEKPDVDVAYFDIKETSLKVLHDQGLITENIVKLMNHIHSEFCKDPYRTIKVNLEDYLQSSEVYMGVRVIRLLGYICIEVTPLSYDNQITVQISI